jgi:hypothetical protein
MKALGLTEQQLRATPAYVFHDQEDLEDQRLLFQARVLAFFAINLDFAYCKPQGIHRVLWST